MSRYRYCYYLYIIYIYIRPPGLLVGVVPRHVAVAHEPGLGRAGEHWLVLARRAGDGLRCTTFARYLHNLATLRISSPSRCRGSSEASSSPSELESLAPAAAASRWDSTREAEVRIVVTLDRTYLYTVYLHVLFDTGGNQSFFRNQPHRHIV